MDLHLDTGKLLPDLHWKKKYVNNSFSNLIKIQKARKRHLRVLTQPEKDISTMTNAIQEVNKLNTQLLSWSFIFGRCPVLMQWTLRPLLANFQQNRMLWCHKGSTTKTEDWSTHKTNNVCLYMSPLLFVTKYTLAMSVKVK